MNKNTILKDFLELKKEGIIEEPFSNYEELLDVLSNMFEEEYEKYSDAQEAYDNIDDTLNGLLNKHCGVYTLGSKEWEIICSNEATQETINNMITDWNEYYGTSISDINDLCGSVTHRVMKDMSNAGCDVYNALAMICNDVFTGKNALSVDIGELNPRIYFLD